MRARGIAVAASFALVIASAARAATPAGPGSVTVAGSFQSEVGCPGAWQPDCATTHLAYDASDGIWQGTVAIPAGSYEYKIAIDDGWNENYPAANLALALAAPAAVKFYFDPTTHWVADDVNDVIATVAGSFQSELLCPGDYQPDCLRTWLQDPDDDGIYVFETTLLVAGDYECKVAIRESWDENYGVGGALNGASYAFHVAANGDPVAFTYDAASHVLTIDAPEPTATASLLGAAAALGALAFRRSTAPRLESPSR